MFFFFFFKQKTAYEIVSGDWSSDVCSSDLVRSTYQARRKFLRRKYTTTHAAATIMIALNINWFLAIKGSRSSICPRHRIYRSGRRYSRRLRANRVSVGSMWIYLASDGNHGSAVAGQRYKKDRRQHKARQRAKTHRLCAGNCSFFCSFLQREWHGREL